MKRLFVCAAIAALVAAAGRAEAQEGHIYKPEWASIDSRPVPSWFEDAKFGIFVHWGLYSVPAMAPVGQYAEWYWWRQREEAVAAAGDSAKVAAAAVVDSLYRSFAPRFTAELFDAGQWADMFRDAGARYVVLTSKHHDGYTLWPSGQSPYWNSVDNGPRRDICGELTGAVKAEGMRMGFYYSLYEWFNPLYRADVAGYVDRHMMPQMKDLVTRYEPSIVWTDGEWEHTSAVWRSTEFLAWLYNESAVRDSVAVNDRWGSETRSKHGGYFCTEYDHVHSADASGTAFSRPWEECRGIGHSFGYNRMENLEDYSSSTELVHMLINKVARGGNLLLNVGPTADGRIPVIMQQRLADIGDWLRVNGEAIYDTRPWKGAPAAGGGAENRTTFYTIKGGDLYVIVTHWDYDSLVVVDGVRSASKVTMLGWEEPVKYVERGTKFTIYPPETGPSDRPCDHAWVYKIEGFR